MCENPAFLRISLLCFLERGDSASCLRVLQQVFRHLDAHTDEMYFRQSHRSKVANADNVAAGKTQKTKDGLDYKKVAITPNNMSEFHRLQLRAWQTAVALIARVSVQDLERVSVDGDDTIEGEALLDSLLRHFNLPQLPDIRTYMEYTFCLMAQKCAKNGKKSDMSDANRSRVSKFFTDGLCELFENVSGAPQILSSGFVLANYWVQHVDTSEATRDKLIGNAIVPFLSSNVALVRGVAQCVFFRCYSSKEHAEGKTTTTNPALLGILRMLEKNKD